MDFALSEHPPVTEEIKAAAREARPGGRRLRSARGGLMVREWVGSVAVADPPYPPRPGPPPSPEPPTAPLRVPARVAVPAEPAVGWSELQQSLDSLRTALALVGVLAVAGLGLALWALLRPDHDRTVLVRGAVPAQTDVGPLKGRVSRLEGELRGLQSNAGAHAGSTASLSGRIDALQRSVSALQARSSAAATPSALGALSGRVDKLAGQVSALQSSRSGTGTSTGGTTTAPG